MQIVDCHWRFQLHSQVNQAEQEQNVNDLKGVGEEEIGICFASRCKSKVDEITQNKFQFLAIC